MIRRRPHSLSIALTLAILGAGLLASAAARPAHADETAQPRLLTVSGEGEVSAKPDIAYIETGVVTEAKTAAEALQQNTERMKAVFETLKQAGIEERDMQTSQFSVSPIYAQVEPRRDGTYQAPVITGYSVTNQVSVTVRNLDRVGEILDKLVVTGSNQLNGIRFAIEKPQPLLDRARELAVAEALRKAKLLVNAAGVTLGRIVTISEGGSYTPMPKYAYAMAEMRDAAPIAAGEQTLTANVSLTIEIE